MFSSQRWFKHLIGCFTGIFLGITMVACGTSDTGGVAAPAYPAPINTSVAAYPVPTNVPPALPTNTPLARSSAPSLVGATPQEVGRVALTITESQFPSISGTPAVALAQAVTSDELAKLGLPSRDYSYCTDPPPLMLVIIKGDFDMSSMIGPVAATAKLHAQYIIYVFDLRAGAPTTVAYSQNGGKLRLALNDPNLPDDPTAIPPAGPTAKSELPPLPTPSTKRPCFLEVTAAPAPTPVP